MVKLECDLVMVVFCRRIRGRERKQAAETSKEVAIIVFIVTIIDKYYEMQSGYLFYEML